MNHKNETLIHQKTNTTNGKNKTNPLRKSKFHFDDTSTKINDEEFKHIEKIQKEITDLEVPAFIRRQQQ